jgi:pyruvate/2-oxoglutarate dehydrogenase complex dihydrolipoamide dehydrogenase (E3) component
MHQAMPSFHADATKRGKSGANSKKPAANGAAKTRAATGVGRVSDRSLGADGRAMTLESSDGFVRVVARRDNHLIVGWQAVGRSVSELSTAFGHSIEMGARLEDTAGTIHAHPTLGEAVQEAALRALGRALHV